VSHASASNRQPLTLSANIFYGVGSIAFGVHQVILTSALMLFYNQVVGLPAAWVGATMMVTLIFDAVCDPLIGEWSDHTRSRWGRRHLGMVFIPIVTTFSAISIAVLMFYDIDRSTHERNIERLERADVSDSDAGAIENFTQRSANRAF